jgi:hypothetical protein
MTDNGIHGSDRHGFALADVGETLGMSVPEMRAVRNRFGELLGLAGGNRIPEELVPVIALIHRLRQRGMPDNDIERELRGVAGRRFMA